MDEFFLLDGPAGAETVIAFAHGAGAPMDTPFMTGVAGRLGKAGLRVVRFEFPYMAQRRIDGRKRGPDRAPVLLDTWRCVAERFAGAGRLFLAGKSMGGRYASLFAAGPDSGDIAGVICLGYPFHPPGKPERLRTDHFGSVTAPMLIVQGERDTFGTRSEVETYALPASVTLIWAPDGDHSLKPRRASGISESENLDLAAAEIVRFAVETAR